MSRRETLILAVVLATLLAIPAAAAKKGPFNVNLRYMPQEGVGASVPTLAVGISERPVKLAFADGRTVTEPTSIGDSSDDDDKVWPVHATNDVVAYAQEVLAKNVTEWGIRVSADAPLVLAGRLTRFYVNESNKPVGSMYNADVRVAFTLSNAQGEVLWEGPGVGDATRYGRSRSEDNVNEVLSDAIKEAYAAALAETALQNAWLGKTAPVASVGQPTEATGSAISPQELLAELVKLKQQGFTTDLMVNYVRQKRLSSPLTADDMVKWKDAGIPQEVIRAALDRA